MYEKSAEKQQRDPGTPPAKNSQLKRKNSKFDLQDDDEKALYRVSVIDFLYQPINFYSPNSNMIPPKRELRKCGN